MNIQIKILFLILKLKIFLHYIYNKTKPMKTILTFINELALIIKKRGPGAVILAIIVAALLYWNVTLINDKYSFFKIEVKDEIKKEHTGEINSTIKNSINADFRINKILEEILIKLSADRVYVVLYHNGGTFPSGIPFIKATEVYEVTERGIGSKIRDYQQLPISVFAYWNKVVLLKKTLYIPNIDSLENKDASSFEMLREKGAKSFTLIGLYDHQEVPLGFIGVEHVRTQYLIDSVDILSLKRNAAYISGLLY